MENCHVRSDTTVRGQKITRPQGELFIYSTYKFDLETCGQEAKRQRNIFKTTWRLRVCSSSSSSSFSLLFPPICACRRSPGVQQRASKTFAVYRNNRTADDPRLGNYIAGKFSGYRGMHNGDTEKLRVNGRNSLEFFTRQAP